MLKPVLATPAAAAAVSAAAMRVQCRIDTSDDDAYLDSLVAAATAHIERELGIALIDQTWRQDFASFDDTLRLAPGPVSSISSLTYYDGNNATQTLAGAVYGLFEDQLGFYAGLKPDQSWPDIYDRPDAIRVTFVSGFGASDTAVPPALAHVIKLLAGHWYAHREAVSLGDAPAQLPLAVESLLSTYTRPRV